MADDGELVTVYETDLRERIALAEYALRAAGIPYIAANATISVIYPVDGMAIVRFQVCPADAERALGVIRSLNFGGRGAAPAVEGGDTGEGRTPAAARPHARRLRLELSMNAEDARERLRTALAGAEGMVKGTWSGEEFVVWTSSPWIGRRTGRGRITPCGAGSELVCRLGSGLLRWLGPLLVLAAAVCYLVGVLLTVRRAGSVRAAFSPPFAVSLSVWGLLVIVWGVVTVRRQGARLREFLCEVFGDVVLPQAVAEAEEA
jgi:hypothetical protein